MIDILHIFLGVIIIILFSCYCHIKTKYEKMLTASFEKIDKLQSRLNNKIADLDPVVLDTYLESIMIMQLRIEAAANSTASDPNAPLDLYARGMVALVNYLGETANIIKDRYGKDYLKNWFDMRFKMMYMSGEINKIIKNPPYSREYQDEVNRQNALNILMQLNNKKPAAN